MDKNVQESENFVRHLLQKMVAETFWVRSKLTSLPKQAVNITDIFEPYPGEITLYVYDRTFPVKSE